MSILNEIFMYIKKHKLMSYILAISLLMGQSFIFTGCGTLSLETNVKMTKSVFLRPQSINNKTIYMSVKNISEEDLKIKKLLESRLKDNGYTVILNPDDAEYVLLINILFANNLKEANALNTAVGLGGAGLVTALGTSDSSSEVGDSLLIGAGVALAGGLVSKALEDEIYRAVIDISVNQKIKQDDNVVSPGTMGKNYKEYKTRVIAEAVQTNLKLKDALPIMSKDVARQISNIF